MIDYRSSGMTREQVYKIFAQKNGEFVAALEAHFGCTFDEYPLGDFRYARPEDLTDELRAIKAEYDHLYLTLAYWDCKRPYHI